MKNILVPTDFSVQSLRPVHDIVRLYPQQPLRIYLLHMLHVPTDIMDLLFVKKYQWYQRVPDKCKQAIEMLKNKYPSQITWMGLEFYYGSKVSVLNDIVENLAIDEVYVLDDHQYSLPFKQSVDMVSLVKRCKAPVNRVQRTARQGVSGETQLLSSLFAEEYQVPPAKKLQQA